MPDGKHGYVSQFLDIDGPSTNPEGISAKMTDFRVKYHKNLKIGTLNVCSLAAHSKFETLKDIVKNTVDILILTETHLNDTHPTNNFLITGYCCPYRYDRGREKGAAWQIFFPSTVSDPISDAHVQKITSLYKNSK